MSSVRLLLRIAEMNSHTRWSREQVIAYREKMLRRMLHYAYDNCAFYRELYSSHGIKREDLNEIPHQQLSPVDKEIVMSSFSGVAPEGIQIPEVEEFLNRRRGPLSLLRGKYRVIHTSGSTGRIGYFIYGPRDWNTVKALALRIFPSFSLVPRRYAYVGAVDGNYAGISLFSSPRSGGVLERLFYHSCAVNVNWPVSRWVEILNRYRPHVLCGYPAAINILAGEQLAGRLKIFPLSIVCGGEPLTFETISNVKKGFGISPIDYYASSESMVMGVKYPESQYMYLFDDVNYFEPAEGSKGYFLTNLYNYAFPLIRYHMSDQLVLEKDHLPGTPFLCARQIAGRSEELLWLQHHDGAWEFIHPITFVEFYSPGLKQFQVVRESPRSLCLRAVFTREGDKKLINLARRRMQQILDDKGLESVEVKIEEVQAIPPDPVTGKTPLIKIK